jgi:hypothetical protein
VQLRFLGDSFDIVKKSLFGWLESCRPWSAHPMFTENVSHEQVQMFERLLGVPLISLEALSVDTDRATYFACARDCQNHLFIDPDTGLCLKIKHGKKAPLYLFGSELVAIANARPERLTLVFDKSVPRGREAERLRAKLNALSTEGIHGVAYMSHACFLLVGRNSELVDRATQILLEKTGVPKERFVKT